MSAPLTVRCVVVRKGCSPEVVALETGLTAWQAMVCGMIEVLPVDPFYPGQGLRGVDLVCNEEGKLLGLPYTLRLGNHDAVAGDCFFTGGSDEEGEPTDLSDAQVTAILVLLLRPGVLL